MNESAKCNGDPAAILASSRLRRYLKGPRRANLSASHYCYEYNYFPLYAQFEFLFPLGQKPQISTHSRKAVGAAATRTRKVGHERTNQPVRPETSEPFSYSPVAFNLLASCQPSTVRLAKRANIEFSRLTFARQQLVWPETDSSQNRMLLRESST